MWYSSATLVHRSPRRRGLTSHSVLGLFAALSVFLVIVSGPHLSDDGSRLLRRSSRQYRWFTNAPSEDGIGVIRILPDTSTSLAIPSALALLRSMERSRKGHAFQI